MSRSHASIAPMAQRLRVATYNVHGCVGNDGQRDVKRIARVLRELNADVIALQELACPGESEGPIALLAELTHMSAIWTPLRSDADTHYGNALLSTLPILSKRTLDLSFEQNEPRSALDVYLDMHGVQLRVIATHLGLRPRERRHQVQRILDLAAHTPDVTTILLGDINEWWMGGRPLRWLHRHFGRSRSLRTFPAVFPVFALDRVWVHPVGVLREVHVHHSSDARCASDHLPVVAELELEVNATSRPPHAASPASTFDPP